MGIIFRKSKPIIVEKGKETKGLKKKFTQNLPGTVRN
jgi:hypothetical protein